MDNKNNTSSHEKPYRSKVNRIVGGVCGGIAEYFNIDPLIVRIGWVFVTLFAGAGIIAYIAALIVVPDNPNQQEVKKAKSQTGDGAKLWGSLLIIIGGILLLQQTGLFYRLHWWSFPWQGFLAVLLVGFGIYLIYVRNTNKESQDSSGTKSSSSPIAGNLYRIHENKMIAGVCTGLSVYFGIDVTLVRLLWVFATLASAGLGILAYIIAIIVFPEVQNAAEIKSSGGKQ